MYFHESFWRLLIITERFSLDKLLKLQIEIGILLNPIHSFTNSTFAEVFNIYFLCHVHVSIGFDTNAAIIGLPNLGINMK